MSGGRKTGRLTNAKCVAARLPLNVHRRRTEHGTLATFQRIVIKFVRNNVVGNIVIIENGKKSNQRD